MHGSRYKGNNERCPHCQMKYGNFRTGFTYKDIVMMFWDDSDDPGDWTYKRRGTILGKWFEIKQDMWQRHIEVECEDLVPF